MPFAINLPPEMPRQMPSLNGINALHSPFYKWVAYVGISPGSANQCILGGHVSEIQSIKETGGLINVQLLIIYNYQDCHSREIMIE